MKLKLACGNINKVHEWQKLLMYTQIDWYQVNLTEIQGTITEITSHKAKEAYNLLKCPCVVEDCSLFIDGMGDLPGPYIKHFESLGYNKIIRMVRNMGNSSARAVCSIGFHDGNQVHMFYGTLVGQIVPPRVGGFGWDAIFEVDGQTLAENKNRPTHRSMAIEALENYLIS